MVKIHNFVLILGICGICSVGANPKAIKQNPDSIEDLRQIEQGIQAAVKKVRPATVSLFSIRTGASGSGVVVSPDGLVLTAAHVVSGTREMTVVFPDGEEFTADVLGMNYETDAGMLKVRNASELPHANYKTSRSLKIGDFVVAMGHAGGYDVVRKPPVRFGRVVSLNTHHFFSTDCTIIGGDSGGPLVDLEGNIVGIHSSIGESSATNNHAGISGFLRDWDRMKHGDVWGEAILGPMANPDTPVLGIETKEARAGGLLVNRVMPNSPAKKAGMRRGDVLLSIDNVPTNELERLIYTLSGYRPGNVVKAKLRRRGKVMEVNVKLTRRGDFYGR